jgi:hypothetical protein
MAIASQKCPVCSTPLSETKFAEVQDKIRQEEEQKFALVRAQLERDFGIRLKEETASAVARANADFQKQISELTGERSQLLEKLAKAATEAEGARTEQARTIAQLKEQFSRELQVQTANAVRTVREDAERQLEAKNAEHVQMADKICQLETREAALRLQNSEAIERLRAQFNEQLKRYDIEANERAKSAVSEQLEALAAAKGELDAKVASLETANKQIEAAKKKAEDDAERKVQTAITEAQRLLQSELEKQRSVLDQHRDDELRKQRAQFAQERESWDKEINDLKRKLEQKTSHELGEGQEVDIYNSLRDAFQGDSIRRVAKGQNGADIVHEIVYKGETCGSIVIDSKNRHGWRDNFVEKLRQDQLAIKADHAILATSKFPGGEKDLVVRDGVIVSKPIQVVALVTVLRDSIIQMHRQGLSSRDRVQKTEKLYQYITSDRYRQQFAAAQKASQDLQQLDVEEYQAQEKMRQRRGVVFKSLDRALRDMNTNVATIVEGVETGAAGISSPKSVAQNASEKGSPGFSF